MVIEMETDENLLRTLLQRTLKEVRSTRKNQALVVITTAGLGLIVILLSPVFASLINAETSKSLIAIGGVCITSFVTFPAKEFWSVTRLLQSLEKIDVILHEATPGSEIYQQALTLYNGYLKAGLGK